MFDIQCNNASFDKSIVFDFEKCSGGLNRDHIRFAFTDNLELIIIIRILLTSKLYYKLPRQASRQRIGPTLLINLKYTTFSPIHLKFNYLIRLISDREFEGIRFVYACFLEFYC